MIQYDVLFMADHFVMVTTIEMRTKPFDKRDIEDAAWEHLTAEYDVEWVNQTKKYINQVSIEEMPGHGAPND